MRHGEKAQSKDIPGDREKDTKDDVQTLLRDVERVVEIELFDHSLIVILAVRGTSTNRLFKRVPQLEADVVVRLAEFENIHEALD